MDNKNWKDLQRKIDIAMMNYFNYDNLNIDFPSKEHEALKNEARKALDELLELQHDMIVEDNTDTKVIPLKKSSMKFNYVKGAAKKGYIQLYYNGTQIGYFYNWIIPAPLINTLLLLGVKGNEIYKEFNKFKLKIFKEAI